MKKFYRLSNIKKQLPPNCIFQNRGLARYALHCLGIIYMAAYRGRSVERFCNLQFGSAVFLVCIHKIDFICSLIFFISIL
jgi:hypothetical protein